MGQTGAGRANSELASGGEAQLIFSNLAMSSKHDC
jgi:hypothetical protein